MSLKECLVSEMECYAIHRTLPESRMVLIKQYRQARARPNFFWCFYLFPNRKNCNIRSVRYEFFIDTEIYGRNQSGNNETDIRSEHKLVFVSDTANIASWKPGTVAMFLEFLLYVQWPTEKRMKYTFFSLYFLWSCLATIAQLTMNR